MTRASADAALDDMKAAIIESLGITAEDVERLCGTQQHRTTCRELHDSVAIDLTPSQRKNYGRALRQWIEKHGDAPVNAITPRQIEAFCKKLEREARARGKTGVYSFEHALDALRWLFTRAVQARDLYDNPAHEIKSPPRPRSGRRALMSSELADIWWVATTTGNDPELDGLILRVHRETAARRISVIRLRLADVDTNACALTLNGKAAHNPLVPISRALHDDLIAHNQTRTGWLADPEGPLLRQRSGRGLTTRRYDALFGRIKRHLPWARQLGLSSHFMRHTTLTDIELATDTKVAAAYAGHYPNRTIDIYTQVPFHRLQEAHALVFGPTPEPNIHTRQQGTRRAS